MREHEHIAPRLRKPGGQRRLRDFERAPGRAQAHCDGQGIAGSDQIVAEQTVERRQDGFAFRRGLPVRNQRRNQSE